MTGYVEGSLTDSDGADALLESAELAPSRPRASSATPNLNLHGTGLDGEGLPVHPVETVTGPMWPAAVETLGRIADARPAGGRGVLPGEPEHRGRPPRDAVRARRGHRRPGRRRSTARTCG